MRDLAAIDADIERVLTPYGVTLDELLPVAYGPLPSVTPLPPGCMDARDYLEQLDTYQSNVRDAEAKLALLSSGAAEDETKRSDEHLRRALDLYEAKLYRFSRLWRPIDAESFRKALHGLVRERINTAVDAGRARAQSLVQT
jgi:hypothetical protein